MKNLIKAIFLTFAFIVVANADAISNQRVSKCGRIVQLGMTYKEVINILGSKGEQSGAPYNLDEGKIETVYAWPDNDKPTLTIHFINGVVGQINDVTLGFY